jgi:hypothetical protein
MKTRTTNPAWPYDRYADLFECMRCGEWHPFWWYNYHPNITLRSPSDVEEVRDRLGHMWACKGCFMRETSLCACVSDQPQLFPNYRALPNTGGEHCVPAPPPPPPV